MPPPLVIDTPVRLLTPNNRSLSFLQSGPVEQPQLHVPQSTAYPDQYIDAPCDTHILQQHRACNLHNLIIEHEENIANAAIEQQWMFWC